LGPFEGKRQAVLAAPVVANPGGGERDAHRGEDDRDDAKDGDREITHAASPVANPVRQQNELQIY
jgi:hypothetical protein